MTTRLLHLDIESFSSVDLKEVGHHVYTKAPDFTVTAVAWAFDDGPVHSLVWPDTCDPEKLKPIVAHIVAGGMVCAHNAAFEHAVLCNFYGLPVPVEAMTCTMQRALAYGLPASLLDAGRALGLAIVKDEQARKLMLKMAKPRKPGQMPWHEDSPAALGELEQYCRKDVLAERALAKAIPELSPFERRVSWLDARSNLKGVKVDLVAVAGLRAAASTAEWAINNEASLLTNGEVPSITSGVPALKKWMENHSTFTKPTLDKEAVEELLALHSLSPKVRRVLELRQLGGKSSLGKLDRMAAVADAVDRRARGLLQYYGAGRTGRWAGRLIQFQNLPRMPDGFRPDATMQIAGRDGALPPMLYPNPLETISHCLRGCLVAGAGLRLLMIDLSQIEARVLAWLAGQTDILDVFRDGSEDIYVYAAHKIGSGNRQLGKVVTLACGYGMGPDKFRETAKTYGLSLSLPEALAAVRAWRAANTAITGYWKLVDTAVRLALDHPGSIRGAGLVKIRLEPRTGVLAIKKPNGEKLYYHNARIEDGEIVFDGVNGTTKQWGLERTYGGKLVENITQAVARDVLADAMLRIEERFGLVPVMSVHDEGVWEMDAGNALFTQVQQEFVRSPAWAAGLPVAAKASLGLRYGK
jgi:DNA polymerase